MPLYERSYLNALEYIDLDAESGEGQFSIAAGNREHNREDHIPNTPTDDEWRDNHFLAATSEVRKHVTTLLACLTGWSVESLTLARPKLRLWSGRCEPIQRIDSAQDIAQPGWKTLNALLYLRRWQCFRGVDDGFVDLYVRPSAVEPWGPYAPEEYNEAFASRLTDMHDEILESVTAIVREVVQDFTVRLACSGGVLWEKEGAPVTGGDAYRFRLVIVEDT